MNKATEMAKKTAKSKRKTHRPCPVPVGWAKALQKVMGHREGRKGR